MTDTGSAGGREVNLVEDPGKRMFFRKLDFSEKAEVAIATRTRSKPPAHGQWLPDAAAVALPGDVFWCMWQPDIGQSDQTELVIAGDEGAILHRVQGQWRRYQTAERLPIHAIYGTCESDLYAVGWMGQVLHYDGKDWQSLRGARRDANGKWLASEDNTPLFAICGNADGQLWAVGDHGLVLHFDGSDWHRQQSNTTAHLRSIILMANGMLLAAGTNGAVILGDTKCNSWCGLDSGFTWSIQSLLVHKDAVLMAGGEYSSISNRFEGRLTRVSLDITDTHCQLKLVTDLSATAGASRLRHLSQRTVDGPVFIVGDAGYAALMRDTEIIELGRVVQHDLLAGTFADNLGLVAIGDFGTLLINDFNTPVIDATSDGGTNRNTGSIDTDTPRWQRLAVPTRRQLWSVAPDGGGRLCCCGDGGVVLRLADTNATHWESMGAPTDNSLHCLVSDGHDGFYVGGQMGQIFHYDGNGWELVFDLQLDITIIDFHADSSDCIFAVGDEGLIIHWDGKQWQRMSSGTKSALYGIWGLDDKHVLTVGDFGLVLRWNGSDWREFHVGTENFLFGIWGNALDNVYVVGLSGTIGHFDGTRWRLTPARAREDLLDVCEFNGELFAVGVNGLVLRQQGRQWVREKSDTEYALRAVCASQGRLFAVGDRGQVVVRH